MTAANPAAARLTPGISAPGPVGPAPWSPVGQSQRLRVPTDHGLANRSLRRHWFAQP